TVSLLFSWTNMIGWFRDTQRDLSGHLDHGKVNRFQTATLGHDTMKGLGFDGFARCQWARLRRPDGDSHSSVSGRRPDVQHEFSEHRLWKRSVGPFSKTGKPSNDTGNWVSSGENLVGAIAVTFRLRPGKKD